jgi:hypothetical protein
MTVITKFKAIHNLVGGQMSWDGDVTYHDGQTPPTEEEINTELASMQTEHDSQEYARSRKTDYPDIGDQLDALYHAGVFPANMAARIKETKDKYPK